jgi:hypothetical protein
VIPQRQIQLVPLGWLKGMCHKKENRVKKNREAQISSRLLIAFIKVQECWIRPQYD